MHLKKIAKKSICMAAALAVLIAGCSPADYQPHEDSSPTPVTTTDPSPSPSSSNQYDPGLMAIGERYEKDGKVESYLTGEWVDTEVAYRRPMAVMIPNNRNALPQYGISYAEVVYEAPMEKCSCTRLMGIFQNYGDLEYIEPIRSSRHYFLLEALSYDAIYCNWGLAAAYVGPLLNSDLVDNVSASVSGVNVTADEAFSRDKDRQELGYSLEYTGLMTIEGYNSAVSRLGYDTKYPTPDYTFPLVFATDAHLAEYEDYPDSFCVDTSCDRCHDDRNGVYQKQQKRAQVVHARLPGTGD